MRSSALAAVLAGALAAGCTVAARPYRFASPMLGTASVPDAALPGASSRPRPELANHDDHRRRTEGRLAARDADPIRAVSAPAIREASAAAATAVLEQPAAQPDARAQLPAPHRLAADAPMPALHAPADLRLLVGRRDKRPPVVAALAWVRELGTAIDVSSGPELLAWAERTHHLGAFTDPPAPGDLLVFDHVDSDDPADLVAVVIARDARGVTELAYLGGGVIRRGFVDPARPAMRRDANALVVNTFLRTGKRWPPKGTHYLAGELLAAVIHLH